MLTTLCVKINPDKEYTNETMTELTFSLPLD